ncbi:hypothetical protein CSC94_12555 [Zhengella mangrovi]|uniref:HTH tetR-type domain-containing protein n=1 Tax=Zhengella mangrovi TaxID=1982044 RepID=A0A2G1QN47_9HYPH|nr:TetR/AcrR family transcriptional regulator [Zhengella mangrovi]PHP66922.1 hypothetical protein CSC94_12555 [Zhengella mangrovi]
MSASTSKSRTRFIALDPQSRARWLDPAEREFCVHGFENASMNRILADASESKGRTYHYFADKGELFRATLERRLEPITDFHAIPDEARGWGAGEFWARLGSVCDRLTRVLQDDMQLASLMRTLHEERAAQAACADLLDALRKGIGSLLTAGQAVGAVRGDLPLALLSAITLDLVVAVDRWFALNAATLSADEEADLSRRAFTLLMAPLLPPHSLKGSLP